MTDLIYPGRPVEVTADLAPDEGSTVPAEVILTILEPDGTRTPYTTASGLQNPSGDVYAMTFVPTQSGRHWVRFKSGPTVVDAFEDFFDVEETHFPEE